MRHPSLSLRCLWQGTLVLFATSPLTAQTGDMSGMHGMHHAGAAPAPVSQKARREIDSVAKAVSGLSSMTAAEKNGFQPRFGWIPTMGVHLVSRQKMMNGRQTDRTAPSQLMFSKINGRDSLVGAAYGYITADNDTVRPVLFDGNPSWHEHPDLAPAGLNLVMLHVWFVPSPDGPFAGTNPNLPFWALGLAPPDSARIRRDSAFKSFVMRAAVALGEVADSTAILPTLKERPEVAGAIAVHRDSVRALLPEFRAAQASRDAARWERVATKAAAQWNAMQAVYLSSAKTPAGRARIERAIATILGEHGE
ncbi:MAG TPA: hypothetical protein VNS10_23840 [Gemmatimonadaceae bacterium]|jgi:hypothetical protein|nr:hypothetical protein [Gemmatimonadaceae bacterium]